MAPDPIPPPDPATEPVPDLASCIGSCAHHPLGDEPAPAAALLALDVVVGSVAAPPPHDTHCPVAVDGVG
jgi:hypothetical protein